jgi:hypothetical protein
MLRSLNKKNKKQALVYVATVVKKSKEKELLEN